MSAAVGDVEAKAEAQTSSRSSQACALSHVALVSRRRPQSSGGDSLPDEGTTSDGVGYCISEKWAEFYPNQEVAIVTSIGQPPIPPEGYVPLRHGLPRSQQTQAPASEDEDMPNGFSLDTLLWNEKLLEQRLMQLTAWTRRSPIPRRQKLDRINRMVNHCNTTNSTSS